MYEFKQINVTHLVLTCNGHLALIDSELFSRERIHLKF